MTDDVVAQVVEMHLQAFDGYMSARLGPIYINALIRWFRNNKQAISLVALDNSGQPAGYVIGAPVGYTVAMNRDLLRHPFATVAVIRSSHPPHSAGPPEIAGRKTGAQGRYPGADRTDYVARGNRRFTRCARHRHWSSIGRSL